MEFPNPFRSNGKSVKDANDVTSLLTALDTNRMPATKAGRPTISAPFTTAETLACIRELGYTSRLWSEEIGEFGECILITITTEEELE